MLDFDVLVLWFGSDFVGGYSVPMFDLVVITCMCWLVWGWFGVGILSLWYCGLNFGLLTIWIGV